MKNVFQIVDDIVFKAPAPYKLGASDEFNPYMVQRWISMESPESCDMVNLLYNRRQTGFADNQMVHDYLRLVLPKRSRHKISYLKKEKITEKSKNDAAITLAASVLEISKKEVMELVKLRPDMLESYAEDKSKVMVKES